MPVEFELDVVLNIAVALDVTFAGATGGIDTTLRSSRARSAGVALVQCTARQAASPSSQSADDRSLVIVEYTALVTLEPFVPQAVINGRLANKH